MVSTLESCSKLKLVHEFMPYAKKAARNAAFKWDIEEDDTFQVIMLDAWNKIDWALSCDVPISALRYGIRYSVGHEVTARYWRRGRGETDQFTDGFDAPAPDGVCHATAMTVAKAVSTTGAQPAKAFSLIYLMGMTRKEASDEMGLSPSGVGHHVEIALNAAFDAVGVKREPKRKRRDMTVYFLVHDDGRELRGNRKALTESLGSAGSVSDLVNGKLKQHKGWRVYNG